MRGLLRFFAVAVLMAPDGDTSGGGGGTTTTTATTTDPPKPAATTETPTAKKPWAKQTLETIKAGRDKRAADAAAKAAAGTSTPSATVIPPELKSAADKWAAYEKAEKARITAEAADLDDGDKALIAGEPDITRAGALLARLKRAADPTAKPAKPVAQPKPAGGPPPSSTVDFAAALKDPKAMEDAKARDPAGWEKFFSGLLKGNARKSSLG